MNRGKEVDAWGQCCIELPMAVSKKEITERKKKGQKETRDKQ